jgi:hypothetical protein
MSKQSTVLRKYTFVKESSVAFTGPFRDILCYLSQRKLHVTPQNVLMKDNYISGGN